MRRNEVGIFFDRDGTINTEVDFLTHPEELELIPNAARAIHEANAYGVKVFVITNQSGIARGLLTEEDLRRIHHRFLTLLAECGARVDGIYYCPHHPDYGVPPYRRVCRCRKPGTGMLDRAAREHGIVLNASFVVGDRCNDILAGKSANCGTVLVLTGYGAAERDECFSATPLDHVAADAYAAWRYIKKQLDKRRLSSP